MITLTLKFNKSDKGIDIQVNRKQKIKDVIRILCENTQIGYRVEDLPQYIISERKKERINVRLTFEQANIYTGDILYL